MGNENVKKGNILEIEMPNGITVKAVVVKEKINLRLSTCATYFVLQHLLYAQNRLFTVEETYYPEEGTGDGVITTPAKSEYVMAEILVDYCDIPEYDIMLAHLEEEQ